MLIKSFESLNCVKLPYSDVGYEIKAFSCIPVRFLFWDGDDEFPANANILFYKNITNFIHPESVVSIAGAGAAKIIERAGLSKDGLGLI